MKTSASPGADSPRFRRLPAPSVLGVVLLVAACAGPGAGPVVSPVSDPGALAQRLEARTRLDGPTVVIFEWRLVEEGLRLGGQGVARVEPPARARLDLFLSNGEGVGQAILVEDSLWLPSALPGGLLPPAELLWATLGVYRGWPGSSPLSGGSLADGDEQLRVEASSGDQVVYRISDGRMARAAVIRGGAPVKEVLLEHDEGELPSRAVYRDLAAYRQLTLTRERVEHVASFPEEIWHR